jgi:hypothetical protein
MKEFETDSGRKAIADSDVIRAVSPDPEVECILFGEHHLKRVVDSNKAEQLDVLSIPWDGSVEELACMRAVVAEIKGYHT